MKYPHRIRLRGPWECEPLASVSGDAPPARLRMRLPCRWQDGGLPNFAGTVRFRRRFGYPGQIDDNERVWLTFSGIDGTATITLNGTLLAQTDATQCEHEVTLLLQARNELLVEIHGTETGGMYGEVAMEVRRTAFLRTVDSQWTEKGTMVVRGEVVGSAERALDLYLLGGRSTLAYTTVEATESGCSFQLETEPLTDEQRMLISNSSDSSVLRVELVDAATVWYMLEVPLAPQASSEEQARH